MNVFEHICAVIREVPEGKVTTYGRVAQIAGIGRNARMVSWALHSLPAGSDVPWHRVVNRLGRISYSDSRGGHDHLQRDLLENEGVVFDADETIDLKKFLWAGKEVE